VNAVAPGWTDTPMWDTQLGEAKPDVFAAVGRETLIGRLVTAEEVGRAVLFLMTNSGITGEVIHIDGGHRLRRTFF
jgi:NAD(P)-dependent dehydrogenase (short-subunit alcohol dehydrogenase family)